MIEKGISFNNIHSYTDLNLFLSGSEVQPAKPKTTYIDVSGGDGSIDLTEAFGDVKFNDRDCAFTFTMNPSSGTSDADFEAKKTEVGNILAGKQCKITLDKDNGYYYVGRCTVDGFLSDKRIRQIVITAKVKPYKYKQNKTVMEFAISETKTTVDISNSRKKVVPEITCSNANTVVEFGGNTYTLDAGTHKVLDIVLEEGTNQFILSGSGNVTFTYQEADL